MRGKQPKLCHHKQRNLGYVTLGGRRIYLGLWGLDSTVEAYGRAIAEYLGSGSPPLKASQNSITISSLVSRFLCDLKATGRTDEYIESMTRSFKHLLPLYRSFPASEFGPRALKTVRDSMVNSGVGRKTTNQYIREIRAAFRWGTSEELIPPSVSHGLDAVDGLRRGATKATETKDVEPVSDEHIEALKPYVSQQVWGLIKLQYYTAARGGELFTLRVSDIDRTTLIWEVRKDRHKTAHHGKSRILCMGKSAQTVLAPFLIGKGGDEYIFSPREAEVERHAKAATHRRGDQKPNKKVTARIVGEHYSRDSYRRAVTRACKAAGIPPWTPHQLRHSAATRIRNEMGAEFAQAYLGHARLDTTEIYAKVSHAKAIAVAEKMG